jgi:hypothetical protein
MVYTGFYFIQALVLDRGLVYTGWSIHRTPIYSEHKNWSEGCSVYTGFTVIWDRHNLFKGEVYIQHLAVLKEKHERRMACFPVLTLYLAHSHCDKKYVNLSKWLWYQNFYFRQKSQLILGQNISSPPLKNKWSPHHVLTLHASPADIK